jgi:hypothetical protein
MTPRQSGARRDKWRDSWTLDLFLAWIRYRGCRLKGGHFFTLETTPTRLALVCQVCGYETPGIEIGKTLGREEDHAMRNFHVVLTDGSERNIKADDFLVEANGVLSFQNGQERVAVYNATEWKLIEVERLDDRGE